MAQRHAIRFGRMNAALLTVLRMGRADSFVEVDDHEVWVHMGAGFSATIPRDSIRSCEPKPYVWWAYGVHGWRGRWVVNGSGHDIVSVKIDPPVRARVLGMPVKLKDLWVSLEDPERFCRAIGR